MTCPAGVAVLTLSVLLRLTHYDSAVLRKPSHDINYREG